MQNDHLLHKWLNDKATEEEIAVLKSDPRYSSYLKIAASTSTFTLPKMDKDANRKAIVRKTLKSRKDIKAYNFNMLWRVAAIITLLFGSYFLFSDSNTIIKTELAQTENFLLPDNSEVILNADSKISYNTNKWRTERELLLQGEAYFDVEKGKTFSVHTSEGTIKVLGTKFNVAARQNFFSVACFEGLVSVTLGDKILEVPAGKKLKIENKGLVLVIDITSSSPDWLSHESSFENNSLAIVLHELERQYNIHVDFDSDISSKRFTGSFTHKDLAAALKSICEPLGLDFKIDKNGNVSIYEMQ